MKYAPILAWLAVSSFASAQSVSDRLDIDVGQQFHNGICAGDEARIIKDVFSDFMGDEFDDLVKANDFKFAIEWYQTAPLRNYSCNDQGCSNSDVYYNHKCSISVVTKNGVQTVASSAPTHRETDGTCEQVIKPYLTHVVLPHLVEWLRNQSKEQVY